MGASSYIRSAIAAMGGYVPGEQPQGGKHIKLNTNENPYPPSGKVIHAITQAAQQGLQRYPDPLGRAFQLRAAAVLGVQPDWILCGNGSDDLLTILTRAFVDQGQTIRIPTPSYVLYKTLAEIQGAQVEQISFATDWSLDERFTAPGSQPKLALLPNPNSPSGTVIAPETILDIAQRLSCPLVVDEAYADFADHHCLDLVRRCEKILVTRTLSKSYGLAGLRFGYLVAQPSMISQLAKVKDSYNCDALSLAGATAAIDDQPWLQENLSKIKASRQRLSDGLRRLGFQVTPSQANFVWSTHTDRAVEPLYQQLKANRILVRYMNYDGWGDGLRISVGTDTQIDACLSVLERLLGE